MLLLSHAPLMCVSAAQNSGNTNSIVYSVYWSVSTPWPEQANFDWSGHTVSACTTTGPQLRQHPKILNRKQNSPSDVAMQNPKAKFTSSIEAQCQLVQVS